MIVEPGGMKVSGRGRSVKVPTTLTVEYKDFVNPDKASYTSKLRGRKFDIVRFPDMFSEEVMYWLYVFTTPFAQRPKNLPEWFDILIPNISLGSELISEIEFYND